MKLKKEYWILIGVIVVLCVFLLAGGRRNKMSYKVPDLAGVNEENITKIEISSAGESLVLSGKNSSWTILPQEYKADRDKVSSMLSIVANLTLTELVAENKDYQRYDLDEGKKITVKAYSGDDLVRTFDVGKVSSTYRHTFVRLGGDPRIYVARESFRSTFEVERGDLRDKTVLTFDLNEITAILIEQEGSTLQFSKTVMPAEAPSSEVAEETAAQPAEGQEVWQTEEGTRGSKTDIDSIVSQMADLKCDSYTEEKSKDDFTDPIYSIKITGSKDYSLQIFAKDEEENNYPAVTSESPYTFLLPSWKAESLMKKADMLVPKEDEGIS